MSTCKSITSKNYRCSRKPTKGGLCSQHRKIEESLMYKKELKALHAKIRVISAERLIQKIRADEAESKLNVIAKIDRIKVQLTNLSPNTQYSSLIKNDWYRPELERIFDADFDQIQGIYFELLNERNDICHPYSRRLWH